VRPAQLRRVPSARRAGPGVRGARGFAARLTGRPRDVQAGVAHGLA
jgi:hypothetical protein